MIKLKIDGIDKTLKDISDKYKNLEPEIQASMDAFAYNVQAEAKSIVSSNSSDTGKLANSIQIDTGEGLAMSIYSSVEYAAYIEFGTRKYAEAYVATLPQEWSSFAATFKGKGNGGSFNDMIINLIKWAQSTGKIDPKNAYALAKKILIQGIPARPFLRPAIENNLTLLKEDIKNIFK